MGCRRKHSTPRRPLIADLTAFMPPSTRTTDMEWPSSIVILAADDRPEERAALAAALRREGYSVDAVSLSEVLDTVARGGYSVVFCDSTTGTGARAIRLITTQAPHLPVVGIVSAGSTLEAHRARAMGATEIVTRPFGVYDLPLAVERALRKAGMWRRTYHRIRSFAEPDEASLDALLSALRSATGDPHENPERVAAYSMELAAKLQLSEDVQQEVARGALLHDVGKLAIPDAVLLKPAPLTDAEWVEVQAHPIIGYRLCAAVPRLRHIAEIVLHHHERWDGRGYPDGLTGSEIPLGARIVSVANAFDAMTAGRAYRRAITVEEAREEIARCSASQFDPAVAQAVWDIPASRWNMLVRVFAPPQAA